MSPFAVVERAPKIDDPESIAAQVARGRFRMDTEDASDVHSAVVRGLLSIVPAELHSSHTVCVLFTKVILKPPPHVYLRRNFQE